MINNIIKTRSYYYYYYYYIRRKSAVYYVRNRIVIYKLNKLRLPIIIIMILLH